MDFAECVTYVRMLVRTLGCRGAVELIDSVKADDMEEWRELRHAYVHVRRYYVGEGVVA